MAMVTLTIEPVPHPLIQLQQILSADDYIRLPRGRMGMSDTGVLLDMCLYEFVGICPVVSLDVSYGI